MEKLKQYNNDQVIKLGKKLLTELELTESVDTLSKWMVSHLADLFVKLEKAKTKEKKLVEEECVKTILTLWEGKDSLSAKLDPINDLLPVIEMVQSLNPDNHNQQFGFEIPQFWESGSTAKVIGEIDKIDHMIKELLLTLQLCKEGFLKSKEWNNEYGWALTEEESKLIKALEHYYNGLKPYYFKGNYENLDNLTEAELSLKIALKIKELMNNKQVIVDSMMVRDN